MSFSKFQMANETQPFNPPFRLVTFIVEQREDLRNSVLILSALQSLKLVTEGNLTQERSCNAGNTNATVSLNSVTFPDPHMTVDLEFKRASIKLTRARGVEYSVL
jgi:hypothetical protein